MLSLISNNLCSRSVCDGLCFLNSVMCRFLQQLLLFFFLHQMSTALFRLMGSLGRNMIVSNTFGSFAMLVIMALGGYIISRGQTNLISISLCSEFVFSM